MKTVNSRCRTVDFESIELGELLALGALQDRVRTPQIGGRRSFDEESVYFDTPDVSCHRLTALRRRRRFKTRDHRGHTVKQRQLHEHDAHNLPETTRQFIDHVVVGAELPGTRALSLRPTLTTTYRRRTLFLPVSASRVTIDTDLR